MASDKDASQRRMGWHFDIRNIQKMTRANMVNFPKRMRFARLFCQNIFSTLMQAQVQKLEFIQLTNTQNSIFLTFQVVGYQFFTRKKFLLGRLDDLPIFFLLIFFISNLNLSKKLVTEKRS